MLGHSDMTKIETIRAMAEELLQYPPPSREQWLAKITEALRAAYKMGGCPMCNPSQHPLADAIAGTYDDTV
jgi:hypothetical protein